MRNTNTKTKRTASDLFIDQAAEQKKAMATVKATRRYSEQVINLLQVLAGLEDAVRSRKVSGVKVSAEYGAVLAELKKTGDRAFRYDANVAGLWAERACVYGNDIMKY